MPRVNKETTVRYRVRALVVDIDGLPVFKEWKAASFQHIQELDPSFADLPMHYFKNICRYRQPDGTWRARSRKPRVQRHIYVERLGFTQIPGKPLRAKRAALHPKSPAPSAPPSPTTVS